MGSASSTLSPEQTVKIKQTLRERCSFLIKNTDIEEKDLTDQMKSKLASEYDKIVQEMSSSQETNSCTTSKPPMSVRPSTATRTGAARNNNTSNNKEERSVRNQPPTRLKSPTPSKSNESSRRINPKSGDSNESGKPSAPVVPKFKRGVSYRVIPAESNVKDVISPELKEKDPNPAAVKIVDDTPIASPRTAPIISTEGDSAAQQVDCWETTEQPYCPMCKMVFKSDVLLQRHLKHSTLHSDKAKPSSTAMEPGEGSSLSVSQSVPQLATIGRTNSALNHQISSPSLLTKMLSNASIVEEEGSDEDAPAPANAPSYHKLLYSGSKFFWRTKVTIDLHIYHHQCSEQRPLVEEVLEVVGFEVGTGSELKRLYVSHRSFVAMMEGHANHSKVFEQLRNEWLDEVEHARRKRKALMGALLERLQWQEKEKELVFAKLAGDEQPSGLLLAECPEDVAPVKIKARHDRTSSAAMASTLTSVEQDSQALSQQATSQAEKRLAA